MAKSWWQFGESAGIPGRELGLYRIECAFCNERGNWTRVFHAEKRKPNSLKALNFDIYQCGSCAGYVHVLWSASEGSGTHAGLHEYRAMPWPISSRPEPSEHWPQQIARFWAQAHQSTDAEIWDGASVMVRSALQSAFREQGAVGRTLKDEIDNLANRGLLPAVMKDWATEIRLLGNESAHPEIDQTNANPQDIRDAIKFLDLFLYYSYDLPAQIKQYRERRSDP